MARSLYHSTSYAREYDDVVRAGDPIHLLATRTLVPFAGIQPGQTVLDLGAGTGLVASEVMAYRPGRLILVDASRAMLRVAEERLAAEVASQGTELQILASDAGRFARLVEPACVDVLLSNYALSLVPHAGAAIRQIAAVLKPGGVAVFDMLPPSDEDAQFISASPPARVFSERFMGELDLQYAYRPRNRRRACLDLDRCTRFAEAAGLEIAETLRTDFVLPLEAVERIWRYAWYFSIPVNPVLRRVPRPEIARAVERALEQSRESPEYRAWQSSGEPLRETYLAVKLRRRQETRSGGQEGSGE